MHVLASRPVDELLAYEQYTAEHGLPLWRIEMQLDQIALLIDAQRNPGQGHSLRDYVVRPAQPAWGRADPATTQPTQEPTESEADATAELMGFKPANRRKPAHLQTPVTT